MHLRTLPYKNMIKKITFFFAISCLSFNSLAAIQTPTLPEPPLLKNAATANIQTETASAATPAAPQSTVIQNPTSATTAQAATAPTPPKLEPTQTIATPPQPSLNKPIPTLNKHPAAPPVIPAPPAVNAKAYLLMDADSGYVIAQNGQDGRLPPASLTKLMTMYVVSAALKEGRIKLTDNVPISEYAWRTGGSRMFVKVGTQVPIQDLINGIIVASGNDACVAMAEFIAGSENSFVDIMNQMAQQLGMKNTHYADSTGLPDPTNYTTPFDLSILTRAIIYHYPEDYKWYSQKWMMYNNIKQPNRNLLLFRDPTVDGLKTGHTDEAGYCLVASAKRSNNMRLIAIVMGSDTTKQRAADAESLLNYGFRFYETHQLYAANAVLSTQRVWFGKEEHVNLGLAQNLYVTIPVGQYDKLKANLTVNPKLEAPIVHGKSYGQVQVTINSQVIANQPLIALTDDPVGGFFSRLVDHISLLFH